MIRRKHGKTITSEEFLSTQPKGIVSCDIEDILCKDYVYLLDSMDMEDHEYNDTSFDIFKEIVSKNKVVGFASYFKNNNKLLLMETYIMPEYRDDKILYDEITSLENLAIYRPAIDLVKSLVKHNIVTEISDGIVVSEIPFNTSNTNLNNSENSGNYYSHVYDLNNGSILILDEKTSFKYSKPTWTDRKNYKLTGNISEDYLNKAYEIVSDYDKKYLKFSFEERKIKIVFI